MSDLDEKAMSVAVKAFFLGSEHPLEDAIRAYLAASPTTTRDDVLKEAANALEQVEAEMRAGFGSSFGETREQVRRAIAAIRYRRSLKGRQGSAGDAAVRAEPRHPETLPTLPLHGGLKGGKP